jgi:hypothetical protein
MPANSTEHATNIRLRTFFLSVEAK